MALGVTTCYWGLRLWGNLISGSVLNQSFSSGAIVIHIGAGVTHCFRGNLISAKLIVQWMCLIYHSAVVLNRSFNGQAQSPQSCWPCSMVRSLDRFFVMCGV